MDEAVLILRLILSGVLLVAGGAKLYDGEGSRQSFADFGVPSRLAEGLVWILPLAEIVTAVALLPSTTAWFAGVSAFVLLSVFSVGIGRKLALGETADCHCFGKLQSGPIGWPTLARNLVLTGLAGTVVIAGWNGNSVSAVKWVTDLRGPEALSLVASLGIFALLASVFVHLRRLSEDLTSAREQIAAMKKVIDDDYAEGLPIEREGLKAPKIGLPIGAVAPDFELESVHGEIVGLEDLLAHEKPIVLLFVSPSCSTCTGVIAAVEGWQRDHGGELTFVVMSKGSMQDADKHLGRTGIQHLLLQGATPISEKYKATWNPAAVMITRSGKIASSVVYGESEIFALVDRASVSVDAFLTADARIKPGDGDISLTIGDRAPELSAMDLNGRRVSSSDLLGRDRLLLFWRPDCSWCEAIIDDLTEWEADPPRSAPALIVVAKASREEFRAVAPDLNSLVLLDPDEEIALSYGARSTPSAIVIDAEGRIASRLVVGAKDVLALAGIERVRALIDSVL